VIARAAWLALFLHWPLVGVAQHRITEGEAIARAVSHSAELRIAEAGQRGAEAEARGAAYAFIPEVAVSGRYTRLSELDPRARTLDVGGAEFVLPQLLDAHAARVEASLSLTTLLTTAPLGFEAQEAQSQAAGARLHAARWTAAAEASRRWIALAHAEATEALLTEVEQGHRLWLETLTARVEAGLTSEAERLEVRAQLVSVEAEHVRAAATRASAARALASMLALDGAVATTGLSSGVLAQDATTHPATHPQIEALTGTEHAARTSALRERLSALPQVSAHFGVDVATPHPRAFAQDTLQVFTTWDAGVTVSFSLEGALMASARADRLDADADALLAQRTELERVLRLEEDDAEASLAAAQAGHRSALSSVSVAEELALIRRAQHQQGTLGAAELRVVELSLLRARLSALSSLAEVHLARGRLIAARARSIDAFVSEVSR
jgi:outer membrane protein TolC